MVLLLVGFCLMASAISANKILLYALSPEFLTGIRMTIAGLLLGGYTLIHSKHRWHWNNIMSFLPLIITVVLFTTFFPSNLKAFALAHMASSKMAFFGTLDPFITALYSRVVFKERLTAQKIAGIFIGFVGMMVLVFTTTPLDPQLQAFSVFSTPELAAILAIVMSRFGWIQAQQMLKKEIFSPVQINVLIMSMGGVISLITAALRNQMGIASLVHAPVKLFLIPPFDTFSSTGLLTFFLAYTVIVGNMLGYTFYAHGLKRYSALFISLASFTIPLVVALIGWLFLGEPLSVSFFIACAITFLGLLVFYHGEKSEIF